MFSPLWVRYSVLIQNPVSARRKSVAKVVKFGPKNPQICQKINPRGPGNFLMRINAYRSHLPEKLKAETDFRCKRGGNHLFLDETPEFLYNFFRFLSYLKVPRVFQTLKKLTLAMKITSTKLSMPLFLLK